MSSKSSNFTDPEFTAGDELEEPEESGLTCNRRFEFFFFALASGAKSTFLRAIFPKNARFLFPFPFVELELVALVALDDLIILMHSEKSTTDTLSSKAVSFNTTSTGASLTAIVLATYFIFISSNFEVDMTLSIIVSNLDFTAIILSSNLFACSFGMLEVAELEELEEVEESEEVEEPEEPALLDEPALLPEPALLAVELV
jgi:hypothetical protein